MELRIHVTSHQTVSSILLPNRIPSMSMITFRPKLSFFWLVGVSCIFLCAGYSNAKSCVETDKQALLKLKDGFIDEGGILSSWKHEVDCCHWRGISCNKLTGHVIKLNLHAYDYTKRLRGNIDSSLCGLQHLIHLNLNFNNFKGRKIPKCIGSLGQLRELRLSDAGIGGSIPHGLQNLSNLQILDLAANDNLIVNDLKWISHLSSLRHLDLSLVDLSRAADWQSSLSSKTPQLRKLILSYSSLIGSFSHKLQNLSHLQTLDLRENYNLIVNNLEWISDLSSLRHLDLSWVNLSRAADWQSTLSSKTPQLKKLILSDSSLVGSFSHKLLNLSNLETLYLGGNSDLTANDLEWISHLSSLRYLDLSTVNLSRALHWQSSLSSKTPQLRKLILSYSSLVGSFSHELQNLSHLQTLDLQGNYNLIVNNLEWISDLSSLRYLYLSRVNLSRVINWQTSLSSKVSSLVELHLDDCALISQVNPKSFFHTNSSTSLKVLSLASNYLNSSILPWVSNISKVLEHLDLSGNTLQHIFPNVLNINSLQVLNLGQNSLQLCPEAFSNMNSLEDLNLSYGSLQHIVSRVFANMISLKSLHLRSTSLQHIASDAFTNTTSLEFLDLMDNELESSMINSTSNLCRLRELRLSNNNFSGPLSGWIPQLGCAQYSMETLDLSDNPFSNGPFPDFSRFSSVKALFLGSTSLHGPIPQSFGHLPYLLQLDLSYNNLTGPCPKFAGSISLNHLDLSNNQLNAILPGSFRKLLDLHVLLLSSNKLSHAINETHLSTLSSLKVLDVSHNLISLNFNSNWVPPFQLEVFAASSCILGPHFPMWLKYQRKLAILDISNSQISDSIPQWSLLSPTLSYLNLSHNKIYGEWPKSFMKMENHYTWDLSFNHLSGPLPNFPPKASNLLLSDNMFSGTISFVCATFQSTLSYLDMSKNLLSGRLPDCWRQLPSLSVLNLADNNFSGPIPDSINTLTYLESIHFNNNNFSGKIPSLMNSPHLQLIDFGQNNLNGKLPLWIGHYLPHLIGLRLKANKFHGSIPTNFCNLSFLQILDLSLNNITGSIPHCFNNLSAMSNVTFFRPTISYPSSFEAFIHYDMPLNIFHMLEPYLMDKVVLVWKGEYDEFGKNLGLMTTIDLSCNHLTREIPSSITSLVALASLNLSRNNLIGTIPNNMGQMERLESLDLSINSLSGEIPISFSALSFLSVLNLSYNNLSGKIPVATQLQTFDPSSYTGNNGLCGLPLTKGCPGDESSNPDPSPHNIDVDGNDKLISFGFYVSMAFGFIVGFWGVCGTLILKNSWRHSYFQFFININDWIYVQVVVLKAKIKRRFQY